MRIFAIGDLHLSFGADKPMDKFGERWHNHAQRLKEAWEREITAEDLVLIPGDISWSIDLAGAMQDLTFVGALPGQKLLLRGNHDYWWSSATQVRRCVDPSVHILQNDAFVSGAYAIAGTRGWTLPEAGAQGEEARQDERIYARELIRLELSLKALPEGKKRIAMLHFPPLEGYRRDTPLTALLEQYHVETCVYAHLHGAAHKNAFLGEHHGITYQLASADYLDFKPLLIAEE